MRLLLEFHQVLMPFYTISLRVMSSYSTPPIRVQMAWVFCFSLTLSSRSRSSRLCQNLQSSRGEQNPSDSLPALKKPPECLSSHSDADNATAQKCVETLHTVPGSIGIPYRGTKDSVPASTCSARLHFTEDETDFVVQSCKRRDIPVTAAVHASVAAVNYLMAADADKEKHYTSTMRFNFRPYLPSPYSGPTYASGLYTTGWMKALPASISWNEMARSYREEYRQGLSTQYVSAHREYALRVVNLMRDAPADGEPLSDVDISNFGVVERLIDREKGSAEWGLQITGVSIGLEILSRQGVCFVWTFRDRLCLNLVYNETFHEKEQMEKFANVVKENLLQELGKR